MVNFNAEFITLKRQMSEMQILEELETQCDITSSLIDDYRSALKDEQDDPEIESSTEVMGFLVDKLVDLRIALDTVIDTRKLRGDINSETEIRKRQWVTKQHKLAQVLQ